MHTVWVPFSAALSWGESSGRRFLVGTFFLRTFGGLDSDRTDLVVEASGAFGSDGKAVLLAEPHQQPVDLCPLGLGQPAFQGFAGLLGGLGPPTPFDPAPCPTQPVADSVHMSVHANSALFLPGNVHAQMSHLWTHSWQFAETLDRIWNVASIVSLQNRSRLL